MRTLELVLFHPRFAIVVLLLGTGLIARADNHRVADGLQVLYDFSGSENDIVRDQSQTDAPIDLRIADPTAVQRESGKLTITKPAVIRSDGPAGRLINAVRNARELTIEVWVQPASVQQKGPARAVTLSQDASHRNLTLGQENSTIDVRLRTSKTSTNGIPSLQTPGQSLSTELAHVLYSRDSGGTARVFINGLNVAEQTIAGDLRNWDEQYHLALGDELSGGRPWLGTFHLVAIYSRALSADEVQQNFIAGPAGQPSPELLAQHEQQKAARHFETSVAPLFARHCLECHDSATHEAGLNLSRRPADDELGESGRFIIPGSADDSILWAAVESDEMPLDHNPLTADEKATLKTWIDSGAVWSLDEIDPAVYVHGGDHRNWLRRLTVDEYIETVRTTLDVDIKKEARELLPADLRTDGFRNTAYNLNVDFKHVDAYAQLAQIIVSRMDAQKFARRFSRKRRFTDRDMGDVISKMGKWVLRGPLNEQEVIGFRGITTTVAGAGGDFREAMSCVLEAMIQSPRFIYRIEQQRGSGTHRPVDQYELASRLSYIIWGAPPDEELFRLADKEQLTREEVALQTERMLNDPRAVAQSRRFMSDWLNLGRLDNMQPSRERFPHWDAQLAQDMRRETLSYFEEIAWTRDQPLSALLNSQLTFATPRLAEFYGLPDDTIAEESSSSADLRRYDLTEIPGRGGLLTQGSVLTVGGDDASMVTRGLLVLHEFLRGVVNDPPPCVDTTPIATSPGLTQRGIAETRLVNANCGGCHVRFEPLAFGLEKFDGIGAWHETDEHGNRLRDDGEILFPGSESPAAFESSAEMMDLLAASERVRQSLTWKIAQFCLGRPLGADDAATVHQIHAQSQENGGTWKAVVRAIVTSDLVLQTKTESIR